MSFAGGEELEQASLACRPAGRGAKSQHALLWQSRALGSQRGEEDRAGGQTFAGRPRRRFRGRDGRRSGEHYRSGGRKCPPVVPKQGVHLPGALQHHRHHQLPQRSIGPRKRWSTILAPPVHHPNGQPVGGVWPGALKSFGGESSTVERVPAGILAALLVVQPHRFWGNVLAGFPGGGRGSSSLPRGLSDSGGHGWRRSIAR